MDVSQLIRQRLSESGRGQKELAAAAQVTESYISQLLTRKKAPPAPGRTDLYGRIGEFLGLPSGELTALAEAQRRDELKKKVAEPPRALFQDFRSLILGKCSPGCRPEVGRIFEKEPFGELERLVTQKILEVAQGVAREELRGEEWLRSMAQASGRSYEQMRVAILEFLDTDVFHISAEGCVSFLDPMIDSWRIDLKTFGMEIALNRRLAPGGLKRFEFAETPQERRQSPEPGFEAFISDSALSGDITDQEATFLGELRFKGRRPSPLYYYRELQNLRDPLHFTESEQPADSKSAPVGRARQPARTLRSH